MLRDGSSRLPAEDNGSSPETSTVRSEEQIAPLLRYIARLSQGQFFGKVTLSFQNGKVHDIKVEQTHKMHELL